MDQPGNSWRDLHMVRRDFRVARSPAWGSPTAAFVGRLSERQVARACRCDIARAGPLAAMRRASSQSSTTTSLGRRPPRPRPATAQARWRPLRRYRWSATILRPIVQVLRERVTGRIVLFA